MELSVKTIRRTNQLLQMALDYLYMANLLRQRSKWQKQARTALRDGWYMMAQACMNHEREIMEEYQAFMEKRKG